MSKEAKSKEFPLRLNFYLKGKRKLPSVSFIEVGNHGVPMTAYKDAEQAAAFAEFNKAAHKFCKQMADAGEFDR